MDYQKLERARIWLALLGAVITGGAALYGVYSKAHQATVASYETLAPEVNDLKGAVERLAQENAELRRTLGLRPVAVAPAAAELPEAMPRAAPPARTATRRPRTAPHEAVRTGAGGGGPAPETTAEAPPVATPPAPPPAAPTPAPPSTPPVGPAGGIFGEIQKKVPVDFEKAAEIYKEIRKRQGR